MKCGWRTVWAKAASGERRHASNITATWAQTIYHNRLGSGIQRHLSQYFIGCIRFYLNLYNGEKKKKKEEIEK